jgi:DNA modification methylase
LLCDCQQAEKAAESSFFQQSQPAKRRSESPAAWISRISHRNSRLSTRSEMHSAGHQGRRRGSKPRVAHRTRKGKLLLGDCTQVLSGDVGKKLRGKVQLILTSPPYPLNRKKAYGNLSGRQYKKWFVELAPLFADLLTPTGSIVIELGNSWVRGRPVQSLLHLQCLLGFVQHSKGGLRLCQQFISFNPSRLPSPAAWVTVNKIRATDSFTHLWWMAKTDFPKADTGRVRRPYSKEMKALLRRGSYNNGKRPSEHDISKTGFLHDRGGSTPLNLFEMERLDPNRDPRLPNAFSFANTSSNDFFLNYCRKKEMDPHPARMPAGLASFFVQFLTAKGDLVLDPFAGTNTTGFVAEDAGRRWVAIEQDEKYVKQARIRFKDPKLGEKFPGGRV